MASLSDHLVRPEPTTTGLDGVRPDTHPPRDATHFRRIVAAGERLAESESESESERELQDAVDAARAAGDSWAVVGAALGTSRQNAQQRFGAGRR